MGALSVNAFKDGGGTTVTGGLRMWDESGAGTGPWSQAPLSLGLVDVTNPDYSANDGATRPLSIDDAGRLRTLDLSSSSQIQAVAEALGTDVLLKVSDPDAAATLLQDAKGIKHWLKLINDRDAASVADDNPFLTQDAGPSWASVWGIAGVPFVSADATTPAAVTDAPTTGEKLVIDDMIITNRHSVTLEFTFLEETTGTVIFGPLSIPAGQSPQFTLRGKRKLASINKKLMVDVSAAGPVNILIGYHSEP